MIWHGLVSASAPTDDRPKVMAGFTNGLLQVRGEVGRRRGFARSTMAKLSGAWANFSGFSEYQGQVFAVVAYGDKLEGFINPGALWSDSQQTLLSGYYIGTRTGYRIIILRNGNQFSTSFKIVAKPGACPASFADGVLAGGAPMPPGVQSFIFDWVPPASGDWQFAVIPALNGVLGPADCLPRLVQRMVLGSADSSGTGSTQLQTTTDGITWGSCNRSGDTNPRDNPISIIFAGSANRWFYATANGYCGTSPDGINFTACTPIPSGRSSRLGWLNSGRLVAVGYGAFDANIFTSDDNGVTWVDRGQPPWYPGTAASAQCVATDGTTLIAGLSGGGANTGLWKSTDGGVNWSAELAVNTGVYSAVYVNGLWVMVGTTGAFTAQLWTSPDLVSFTNVTVPAISGSGILTGIAYNGTTWVVANAVAETAHATVLGTWTTGVVLGYSNSTALVSNVVFGFAAVSPSGSVGSVFDSADGITFTPFSTGFPGAVLCVGSNT